jgi:hypothetical protein
MPKPRQSDDPNALTEHVGIMVTKAELARIMQVAAALSGSKSAAARFLIREGLDTEKVKSLTPQEEDTKA